MIPVFEQADSLYEDQAHKFWGNCKNEPFFDHSSEEIEKYITFWMMITLLLLFINIIMNDDGNKDQ